MQRCVGGGREIDRGVSVCLLLQEVEEVDEEAGFGKSAEGESESDREREADRDRERERERQEVEVEVTEPVWDLVVCACVSVWVLILRKAGKRFVGVRVELR